MQGHKQLVIQFLIRSESTVYGIGPVRLRPTTTGHVEFVGLPTRCVRAGGNPWQPVSSMVVTTSRRTYHIQLKSAQESYMARVGFEYPEDVSEKFKAVNARLDMGSTGTTANPENLNFSYKVSGRARWKPSRVYSDGEKTYIQFPPSLASRDAPVLFVVSGGQNRIVNYRLKGSTMVVDYQVDKAILVSGVGWKQEKITITRGG